MRTPLNPLMYANATKDLLINTASVTTVKLRPGKYIITMCGGGGAGGTISAAAYGGGAGGAGGKGDISSATITITDTVMATIYVGAGGKTYANGGNGGSSDGSNAPSGKYRGNYIGGFGGGGGYPTYIAIDGHTTVQTYFGWKCPPQTNTGTYKGATKRYYVTYDDPKTLYISETPMAYTWGAGFELVNGTTYTDGQQLFYVSDSATVRVNISIANGVVKLVGTATNAFGASVVPKDVTADFVGGTVYTKSNDPVMGDAVYDGAFNAIGTITSVNANSFVYAQATYSRYPAIDTMEQTQHAAQTYFANGGGGGGGGGASARPGRYGQAGAGGGGGGYYRFNKTNCQITSVPGQIGGRGGGQDDGAAAPGVAGNTVDFSQLSSGRGGTGGYYKYTRGPGGAAASGGGASGGGGGGGAGNHGSAYGGAGGGGAGGSIDAGGGACGTGAGYGSGPATNATNHHSTPTTTINYLGETVTAGWGIGGRGQTSGNAPANGADGWFYLTRVAAVAKEDFGFITETVDEQRDYGFITDPVTETIDYGYIKE